MFRIRKKFSKKDEAMMFFIQIKMWGLFWKDFKYFGTCSGYGFTQKHKYNTLKKAREEIQKFSESLRVWYY